MEKQEIIQKLFRTLSIESDSIEQLRTNLNMDDMSSIVQIIGDCTGKIILSGCGTSAMAARKIAHSLNCIERPALFLTPSDAVHGGLGILQKEDILILISKGGNTDELLPLVQVCRTKQAALIGVSENETSLIAKESDCFLKIKVEKEPCPFNMLATASTLAVISAFDSICIALMHYTNYTREQFAVIHPGGAVGNRLLGKVGTTK